MKTLLLLVLLFVTPCFAQEPKTADQVAAEKVAQEMYSDAWQKAVHEAKLRVVARYPDAGKKGSPLEVALQRETERLEKEHSVLLYYEAWPDLIAAKIASDMGILPVKQ